MSVDTIILSLPFCVDTIILLLPFSVDTIILSLPFCVASVAFQVEEISDQVAAGAVLHLPRVLR